MMPYYFWKKQRDEEEKKKQCIEMDENEEKNIRVTKCEECPHFHRFLGAYYDGDCANINASKNTVDTRIICKTCIPKWCPL